MRRHHYRDRWWLVFGCAWLFIFLGPALAGAQTTTQQDVLSLSIEELTRVKVFSASRHLENPREAPSSVSVITADEIARYGWRTLADALNSLRGFYTSYDRNYTYLGVSGFQRSGDYNSRILLLINGHRLNDNVYDGAQIGTEFPLDLDLVDHIEVVRGPSSSLFGTNAVFGIVNVITRKAGAGTRVEVSGDTASFLSRSGRLAASFRAGGWSALVAGGLYRSNGPGRLFFPEYASPASNYGSAENIDGDEYGHVFADLRRDNWRVQGLFSSRTKTIPTAAFDSIFNDPGSRTTDSRGYLDVSYHRALSAATDLDLRTYYDAYRYRGTYPTAAPPPQNRYLLADTGLSDWAGAEVTLGHQMGAHRLTLGAQYEYSFRVNQQEDSVGPGLKVNDHRFPWLVAVYGEAELHLVPRLTIHAGGRFDWFQASGGAFSPRFAAVYALNSRTAFKYIFGRAFRAPNAFENYYDDGVSITRPSPPLQPEFITSHEVVFERTLTSWLDLTADGFYRHLTNLIDQRLDPSSGLEQYVNSGHNAGRGVELELAAQRASGLSGRVSYTLTDAVDQSQQRRLANSPLHLAKLNATVPLPLRTYLAPELLYASAQRSYRDTRVSPSFLTNLTLSTRPLWGGFEFSASCYNVFDRRWYSPAGLQFAGPQIQQDGRTFRFKVTYRLHPEAKSK